MATLQGVGVLVTRPEQQAMPLCRLLAEVGATTRRLPAIEIDPHNHGVAERQALSTRLGSLVDFDLIVFTSANAVRFGVSLLDAKHGLCLAAIGTATARALNQAGYRVAITPSASTNSEGLLLHPQLEHVVGRRILLIKGIGGRPLLEQELTRRGALVLTAEVYARRAKLLQADEVAALHASFLAGEIQVVTATSVEIAGNLLATASLELRADFAAAHWLVAGERIAAAVRTLGLQAPLLVSASADDQDLVAALLRWRGGGSVA